MFSLGDLFVAALLVLNGAMRTRSHRSFPAIA
jgi:cytosine/uracil/thiamine/allantoin permease